MCGIAGFWGSQRIDPTIAERMALRLKSRGPDHAGTWIDHEIGLVFAHRRLSILDPSPAGHQPMASATGRFIIAMNGEIYNHLQLRTKLQKADSAPIWRGHSDTETLLAAFDAWGVVPALKKTVGMFAFAVWDTKARTLTLARDRMGEKPLYYGWINGTLVFASELKAIHAYPGFEAHIERRALALFLRYNCVPAPWSIYEGIWKLPPGCFVQFRAGNGKPAGPCREEVRTYWSLREAIEKGLSKPFQGSEDEAVDELERLLHASIAGQRLADVPLGAFLSGGVDSSTVVAIMQAQAQTPVRTFTIGFHEREYNEAEHAKVVAQHLGTDHTELYVTPGQVLDIIPRIPQIYDEPFSDSSQIPTYLVAQLARRHVTVALSGDGGDELFGGYNRHFWGGRLVELLARTPKALPRILARAFVSISPVQWNRIFTLLAPMMPSGWHYNNPGDKLHKLAGLFGADRPEALYLALVSHWNDPDRIVLGAEEPDTPVTAPEKWLEDLNFEQRIMYLDSITYLPDDILVKVDRAAMSVSLETRAPFLDHRVVEFAWSLPMSMKIRNGQGKWLLRQVLYRHVPRPLVERPKTGFGLPIEYWLRGPLRDWAEELLSESRLKREGFFDPVPIRQKWEEHLSGKRNWQYHLWDVLMFEAWLDHVTT